MNCELGVPGMLQERDAPPATWDHIASKPRAHRFHVHASLHEKTAPWWEALLLRAVRISNTIDGA